MGIPLRVEVPSMGTTPIAYPRLRGADMAPEAFFTLDDRRYLISLFSEDRPGILRALLGALVDGVALKDFGAPFVIRFSIDGSLSAAMHETFTSVLLAKPFVEPAYDVLFRRVRDDLIIDRLREELCRATNIPGLEVYPLGEVATDIFAGRRFSEYRFGKSEAHRGLASVARSFAEVLGRGGVPIAYLQFPDCWKQRPDAKWLRVGVGFDRPLLASIEVDLAALEIAEQYSCELMKYDPSRPSHLLSGRFQLIDDFRKGASESCVSGLDFSADVVLVEGRARPGFVAEMLALSQVDTMLGGSMAVLAGHTVASWLVDGGSGEAFLERLGELTRQRGKQPEASRRTRAVVIKGVHGKDLGAKKDEECWVCWRSGDRPGVLHAVVQEITTYFSGVGGVNIELEVSRVLAEGATCAGKIRCAVPSGVLDGDLHELRERIRGCLEFALQGWTPRRRAWVEEPVLVERSEPAEDPWASLAFT